MLYTTENMRSVASTEAIVDRSIAYTDNKSVIWDTETEINSVVLDYIPKGDILSLVVVSSDGEALAVDGKPSRTNRTISFLAGDDLGGCSAEIKYLIG